MKKLFEIIAACLFLAFLCHFACTVHPELSAEKEEEVSVVETQEPVEEPQRIIDPSKPMIALTFDDGPGKYTDELLDLLEKYDVRATFFLTGTRVNLYKEEIARMHEMGCEIGNHTEHHKDLADLKKKDLRAQIDKTAGKIKKVTGEEVDLLRPPYGSVDKLVQEEAGGPIILWSVDTLDWKKKNAKKITTYIKNNVEDGDIVLLHDIHEFTLESMKKVIPYLIDEGYQIVTVSEMAEAKGVLLKDGKKYYHFK